MPLTQLVGNVLFNDALNAFYLQLYGVTYNDKGHDSTYHSLCYTSCGVLAGMKNS